MAMTNPTSNSGSKKSRLARTKSWLVKRKILTSLMVLVIMVFGYWLYSRSNSGATTTQYAYGQVKRGNIISTVSGTGQVSSANQIDLKSKVSGDITKIYVKTGDTVKAGDSILDIDAHDAYVALQNARISYQKLTQPADAVTRLQTENSLASAKQSAKESYDTLTKSYDDGFSTMANTFVDLPDVMSGLKDMFYGRTGFLNVGTDVPSQAREYIKDAATAYDTSVTDYDKMYVTYKNTSRLSASSTIESVIVSSYKVVKEIADVAKLTKDAVDYLKDHDKNENNSAATAAQSSLNSWTTKINNHLLDLLSITNSIDNAKTGIIQSERNVAEKNQSLTKLIAGADPLDIKSEQLSLSEKEYAYRNYFIKAPFDGVIAKLSVRPVDSISSGTSFGTIIGSGMIDTITLNEVDVLKVKPGQRARLTFDAIDGLTIPATVASVDQVGAVSQGVVSYTVTIAFDRTDDRIRSGMSSSATIITDERTDVLTVPNSAIKSRGNGQNSMKYVEIKDPKNSSTASTTLVQVKVETGLSNDNVTEIISGLNEGDSIVTRTTVGTAARTTTAPSLFGNIGNRAGGGNGAANRTTGAAAR